MSGVIGIITYGLGTVIGFLIIATLIVWFIKDVSQKKHAVLRNYPVVGRLRYFFEKQGEYFRQYFFMNDREELPFNRSTRGWVYRLAKAEGGVIGFGSTNNTNEAGSILFVNHAFPVLEEDRLPTPPMLIGGGYQVLATQAFIQMIELFDLQSGAALAMLLLVPALAAFILQHWITNRRSYITVTGGARTGHIRRLPGWIKWPLFGLCLFLAGFNVLLYGSIFVGAAVKAWGFDYTPTTENLVTEMVLSRPEEMKLPLRWIGLLYGRIQADLAITTGVHSGLDAAKAILAGATVVQTASALLENGIAYMSTMLRQLEGWMDERGYQSLADFRGKLSHKEVLDPFGFERAHYVDLLRKQK